jgi:uncharacterized Fe-S cluster protein YjdI
VTQEARFDEPAREYATSDVVVEWRPELCYHAHECVRGLPAVFDPERRPWIDAAAAPADDVERVVERCPSGALRTRRRDVVEAGGATTVTVLENGPYVLRGDLRILRDGEEIAHLEKVALCRCGHSANKPFCDGSHKRVGFVG